MSHCSRCETLPAPLKDAAVLYIAPPLSHTEGILRGLLKESGLSFDEPLEGIIAVDLTPRDLREVGGIISGKLSEAELDDCKALLSEKGAAPGLGDLVRMRSLGSLIAEARGEWLLDIMREDRLTSHFQPIVSASDAGDVFAYECLLRGLDERGSLVNPGRMFDVARSAGILFNLDRAARLKAIEEAARFGLETNVFINFNPTSIYDPVYCLRSTVDAVKRFGITADHIVFEVTESEEIRDTGRLLDILAFYRRAGFRVALDDLGAGYGSLNLLTELRPDFVKLDMALVHGVDEDPYKATIAAKLLELAGDLGVNTIAEGVETEGQWRWLSDHGADYVQGYYFAKPASPPPVPAMAREQSRR